ncbi:hypothetical protein NHQ30_002296 [Ciborinia camelliae]|nr:hypothetical protein NHQ30_002296 [Ciborinia camelliae]
MSGSLKPSSQIILYRGFPASNAYPWSPFVAKLEARLRFAGTSYDLGVGSPKTAPRGKIPYIGFKGSPDLFSDSTLIIRKLVDEGVLPDLNAHLTPVQRAQDLALRALLEEKLYFYQTREKWCENYEVMRDGALGAIPYIIRLLVGLLAYRSIVGALWGQGTGRLTDIEVVELQNEVWERLNAVLSEARTKASGSGVPFWIFGEDQPSEADAVLYGFLASGLVCDA